VGNAPIPTKKTGVGYAATVLLVSAALLFTGAAQEMEKRPKNMAGWVSDDVREFITAAAQGFESYKKGDPKTGDDGMRRWDSSRKPALAQGCDVRQRRHNLLCLLFE
jgi:hypothetical protein